MEFNKLIEKDFVILDGAVGTMLQAAGFDVSENPEILGITNPEGIISIHRKYAQAGSDIIYANTFGANSSKLQGTGFSLEQVISKAIDNAKEACSGTDCLVALDIGPLGVMLEPSGSVTFEQAYDMFKEKVLAGKNADIIVIETMTDLYEAKAALLAAKENSELPVICTMSFESNLRTFTGCSISAMALTLESLGADAVGINCSLGPTELLPLVAELSKWTSLPLVIKPNAGMPDEHGGYNVTPSEFARCINDLLQYGPKFIGGCCGTTPEFISETALVLSDKNYIKVPCTAVDAVCTPTVTVVVNENTVIGTAAEGVGAVDDAFNQLDEGAEIIAVNIDATDDIQSCIKEVQSVINRPLLLISSKEENIRAAQRVYNGKPMLGGRQP